MKNKNLIIIVLAGIVLTGGAFFAGMKYQQSRRSNFAGQFNRGNQPQGVMPGGNTGNRNGNSFRPVNGEIIAVDEKTVTVKTVDGGSRIVILSESTVYNKAVEGAKSDLKVGEKVAVLGTDNTDSSVTAQSVQLGAKVLGLPTSNPIN